MNPILLDFPDHFETPRLLIRAPRAGDGLEVNRGVCESIEALRPWMPWAQTVPTPEESEMVVRRWGARWLERSDFPFLVFLKATGELVSHCGLVRIDWSVPRMEIGYWQHSRFCGQGLMTEAVSAIANFAFETLGSLRLEIRCDARNQASRRVAERVGFALEATLRNNERDTDGQLQDTLIFSRVRQENQ